MRLLVPRRSLDATQLDEPGTKPLVSGGMDIDLTDTYMLYV